MAAGESTAGAIAAKAAKHALASVAAQTTRAAHPSLCAIHTTSNSGREAQGDLNVIAALSDRHVFQIVKVLAATPILSTSRLGALWICQRLVAVPAGALWPRPDS